MQAVLGYAARRGERNQAGASRSEVTLGLAGLLGRCLDLISLLNGGISSHLKLQ